MPQPDCLGSSGAARSKARRRCCSRAWRRPRCGRSRRRTVRNHRDNDLDLTPLLSRLADEPDAAFGAALFHATLVAALAQWLARAARLLGIGTVACGGGCFLNALLARGLRAALAARGIRMLEAMAVPPNDGGLSLGQAWVGLQTAAEGN